MDVISLIIAGAAVLFIIAQLSFFLSHTEEHIHTMKMQFLWGLPILLYGLWLYSLSNGSYTGTLFLYGAYFFACMAYNGVHNLVTRGGMSDSFGEHFLFGWFKSDNFLREIIAGAIGCYYCFSIFTTSASSSASFVSSECDIATKPVHTRAHHAGHKVEGHTAAGHAHAKSHAHQPAHAHADTHKPVGK
jgi:hypothetical protein